MASTIPVPVTVDSPDLSPETRTYGEKRKLGVIYQDFKLYIEGVEVPFESITLTNTAGALPRAFVTIPYLPFLQEIARNYPAKVHVFYRDPIYDRFKPGDRGALRLLFSGRIQAASYSKSKGTLGGSTSISFDCAHKNALVDEVSVSFARFNLQDVSNASFDANNAATAGTAVMNPTVFAQQSLLGIDTVNTTPYTPAATPDTNIDHVPTALVPYAYNFKGVPGTVLKSWNLMCRDSYVFASSMDYMKRLYIPAVYSIKYWEGMGGHPIIEEYMESNRVNGMLNPRRGTTAKSAVTVESTLQAMQACFQQYGGTTPYPQLIQHMLQPLVYSMETLSAPVMRTKGPTADEVLGVVDPTTAIAPLETILHPVMPLYFAPKCNVIYPCMYDAVSITDSYEATPTRVVSNLPAHELVKDLWISFRYRSPFNVRESVQKRGLQLTSSANGNATENQRLQADVLNTVEIYNETPASHEMGRGVHPLIGQIPSWLNYMTSQAEGTPGTSTQTDYRQLMMDYNDYLYSINLSSARVGQVNCCFNPYIVTGYPMDVIDPSTARPSHHGFCTSVTHSITPSSASTSIGFTNAATYEELFLYDTPTALPWLSEALGIQKSETQADGTTRYYTSLTGASQAARDAANRYYTEVFGVGAAFIDDLWEYKYEEDAPTNPKKVSKVLTNLEDSLAACRRSIQTMDSVEALFELKFIETRSQSMINLPKSSLVKDYPFAPSKAKGNGYKPFANLKIRPGHNIFLDYSTYTVFPEQGTVMKAAEFAASYGSGGTGLGGGNKDDQGHDLGVNSLTKTAVLEEYKGPLATLQATRPSHWAAMQKAEAKLAALPDYPTGLLLQILYHESHYNYAAINRSSPYGAPYWAYGYGQLVAKSWNGKFHGKSVAKLTPEENIEAAGSILESYYKQLHNWNDTAIAYNQGVNRVATIASKGGGVCSYIRCTGGSDGGGVAYFYKIFKVVS